ncbi:hypothetical protein G6M26_42865 [Agrobacterium tumefaciens]|nr:hypothetical protein [Agrobacterium tumefaciens]NTE25290.1 hypothetical protein [Agrobacterium tumefaciens]
MKARKIIVRQSEVNVSLLLLFINGKTGKAKRINQIRFSKSLFINNAVFK